MLLEPPDADTIAMFLRMLDSPHEGHQESTITRALEISDIGTSVVWERAGDKTPAERLRLALQAATEQLEGPARLPARAARRGLLTGRPPFLADTAEAVRVKAAQGDSRRVLRPTRYVRGRPGLGGVVRALPGSPVRFYANGKFS
jgi:hypothetical protein